MLIPVANLDALRPLQALPVVAIDLGFSRDQRSCGFAFREPESTSIKSTNLRYQECVKTTAETLRAFAQSVLIIEAPLSGAFDAKGNPQSRGAFEGAPKPRWWSLRAGAAMALAAQYFLRDFCKLASTNSKYFLIEGFVSGVDSGNHIDVAERLLGALDSAKGASWQQPQGASLTSIVDWIQPGTAHPSPIVLIPISL